MTDHAVAIQALRTALVEKERELNSLYDRIDSLTADLSLARRQTAEAGETPGRTRQATSDIVETDDRIVLQEVGIYTYRHPLRDAEQYRERLASLVADIKEAIRTGTAIESSDMFSFNNSLAKGRKMTADLSKLMLRAYNAEAENCVRTIKAGNLQTATRRLGKARESIAKLGAIMEMRISESYHHMRLTELELTADFMMKQQEERLKQRDERERLREERRAEQELIAQRQTLEKERSHYENLLESLSGDESDERRRVQRKIDELAEAITDNDYRQANIRAGYVYVISNRGAFGPNVIKIGMTRRLDPMDRVKELGSASVPFPFDVHALYFSEDAVMLESQLHEAFADRRLNYANLRREFFFAGPAEVRDVLARHVGNLLEYTEAPDATQYFQSRGRWPDHVAPNPD